MSRRRSRPPTLLPLLETDRDGLAAVLPDLRRLRALQKTYAGPIIADGIFNRSTDLWSGIVAALANEAGRADKQALDGFFGRLRSAGVNTNTSRPSPHDPHDPDLASDVCLSYASTWGDAGFLLGLAVGMQLGPHAFEGGGQ